MVGGRVRDGRRAGLAGAGAGGDSAAFGELYRRYLPDARAMAAQLSGRIDPGDVANEAFLRVLVALRSGGGPDRAFRSYLMVAVRRQVIDQAQRVRPTLPLTAEDEQRVDLERPPVAETVSDSAESLRRAMADLPERWREVLWEVDVVGRPVQDVAAGLGLSPNALSAMIYRARSRLRQILAPAMAVAVAVAIPFALVPAGHTTSASSLWTDYHRVGEPDQSSSLPQMPDARGGMLRWSKSVAPPSSARPARSSSRAADESSPASTSCRRPAAASSVRAVEPSVPARHTSRFGRSTVPYQWTCVIRTQGSRTTATTLV